MTTEVRVPPLGESVAEAVVGTWHKAVGDNVSADEMLCELETDKVSVEVPAPEAGMLAEIVAPRGATVVPQALLATIVASSGAVIPSKAPVLDEPAETEGSGAEIEVVAPALGESVSEATVVNWSKSEGDSIVADEILCELETDKVTLEVPAPASGRLAAIFSSEGAVVTPGEVLASIQVVDAAASSDDSTARRDDIEDAPSTKKILVERGIDPASVKGTGRDGRVMKDDALSAKKPADAVSIPAPVTQLDNIEQVSDSPQEERVRMSTLRQTIARRLKESQNTAAILTTYNEADMSEIMGIRREYKDLFLKKHGVKLGFMSFFVKACCIALAEVPGVNAEIDGTDIVFKKYVHMGIAVGSPTGLVVPVLRNAHAMGFAEIEKRIADAGARARDGQLKLADMQGGTFSISNGGIYGSLMSSPIINPPQSGILGMHKIQDRPVAIDGQVVIRPMMYLALSYDHRIVDGKGAVTFLVRVKESLEDPRRLLMDI